MIKPESISIRTSSNIPSKDVVRVSNPEGGRCLVSVEEREGADSGDTEVILKQVVGLNTILNEEVVSLAQVSHILLDSKEVDTMNGDCSIEGVMNGITNHKGGVDIANHVEVDGISTKIECLTSIGYLNV
jgi:hypothetical protein